jgi:hypothetical protein
MIVASDTSAAWAVVASAIGASAITGLVAYLVMSRQVRAEDRRWFANQEVARRAATADRLRDLYARIAAAGPCASSSVNDGSSGRAKLSRSAMTVTPRW